jgi:hypothetical protein
MAASASNMPSATPQNLSFARYMNMVPLFVLHPVLLLCGDAAQLRERFLPRNVQRRRMQLKVNQKAN